jgi:hypothetical protein
LGLERKFNDYGYITYGESSFQYPGKDFIELVGLWNLAGGSSNGDLILGESNLAVCNDHTPVTPQDIGHYLQSVIEGGEHTPFRPLSDYPEE